MMDLELLIIRDNGLGALVEGNNYSVRFRSLRSRTLGVMMSIAKEVEADFIKNQTLV
jgi:hypothetical protein